MTIHTIRANFQPTPDGVRRATFEGREHLVVPVVMIVEGVLNNALVPYDEFSRHVASWNGRPVPIYHPEEHGTPISANRPDVIERNSVGQVFGARADGGKLRAELWIDLEKADRLGHMPLVNQLESGACIEVSTGYFADDDVTPGEWNGAPYAVVHRNIRPDHLAILPGQIGACSVADGCGTRVNSKKGTLAMKVNEALATLQRALGMKTNCECEGDSMDILKQAEGAMKANAITPAQFKMVQDMAPEDRVMLGAIISALGNEAPAVPEAPEAEGPMDDMAAAEPAVNSTKKKEAPKMDDAAIDALIANRVDAALRRRDVVEKLTANSRNTLTVEQMAAMDVAQLEAVEKMIRPADYSGAGGFAANSTAIDSNVTPLMPSRGVLSKKGA